MIKSNKFIFVLALDFIILLVFACGNGPNESGVLDANEKTASMAMNEMMIEQQKSFLDPASKKNASEKMFDEGYLVNQGSGYPNPVDQAKSIGIKPRLAWGDVPEAKTYDIYIWKTCMKRPINATKSGLTLSYYDLPTSLTATTSYNWQVVVRKASSSTSGPTWKFTTK